MNIFEQVKPHWQQLREGTYQFIDGLKESDLDLKLPFAKSQTIRYQLHCMCGSQESNLSLILENYMILVEHEAHHQGQLINLIFAHHLPIPKLWQEKWALVN